MTIKKKDGTPYKLKGINPLMKDQDHWDNTEWKVHYVEPEEIIIKDPKRIAPEGFMEEDPLPAIVGVGVISNKEIIYCLPSILITEEDPVYGQKIQKPGWGDKFSFEAIRLEYTGFTITFFARMPQEYMDKLNRGSIILVFKQREWWKVNETELFEDGIKIYCVPSELKPSFV